MAKCNLGKINLKAMLVSSFPSYTRGSPMPLAGAPRDLYQGCALAEPGGPWRLTFALGRLGNLRFFIQIICWAPWILQFQSTGLPSIFLRAQPCLYTQLLACSSLQSVVAIACSLRTIWCFGFFPTLPPS